MAVTSAPQAMPPQHLWDPKTKSAHLKMALWMRVSPWGSFPISVSQTCKIFHPDSQLLWSIVDSCLYLTPCDCSPSCLDPDLLLLAYLWLGLSWMGCISTIRHFPHQKQAAGTLHQQQAAGEAQQTHSVEITIKRSGSRGQTVSAYWQQPCAPRSVIYKQEGRTNMDTKKEDTDVRTAPEAPAIPAHAEPGPGRSAVPSVPLHGPVDVAENSLEGLQSAFRAPSVEQEDNNPVNRRREREREKEAGESMADEGVDHGHDPTSDSTFEGAPRASGLHASPSPTTTTLPTSTPITNPPMAEGTGFTGRPTYPAYGVNPPTTAFPEATTTSEPVASSSATRWYAADYHHPLHATGAYVDVPGYETLSGLGRGPESCGSRSRGSGISFNRSLTQSEIKEALRGATSEVVGNLNQEIRAKLEPLIPPQASPTIVGASPNSYRGRPSHPTAMWGIPQELSWTGWG